MPKVLHKIPIIGSLLKRLSMRKKKKDGGDATMYPLY